jgi:hypothetical protein
MSDTRHKAAFLGLAPADSVGRSPVWRNRRQIHTGSRCGSPKENNGTMKVV